jgi:3-deoxy-D-manno-octulosonic-acid transferase
MHLIYRVLSYLLIGGLLPILLFHPKLRQGVRRRFGLYEEDSPWPAKKDGDRIWLHGASAGDLIALLPIILEIRRISPGTTLVVSTMTNSGHAIAKDRLAPHVDGITYVPYDLPGSTRRAVEAIRPDLLVLEYTEIWPNLIDAARARGSRVAMTNGRISQEKLPRYRLLHHLIGNQLEKFDLLLMREEIEAERALLLGAPPGRVIVTGNTKFDNLSKGPTEEAIDVLRRALRAEGERIFVAGSTHEGEERDLFRCFKAMREIDPAMRMIVAPRYVERSPRVYALARAEGLTASARSEMRGSGAKPDVIVLDSMGELIAAYALASLVFVGGSFVRRGGQNILEPAGQGRPVLFGPNMVNFRDSVEVLLGRGGIQVQSPRQLERVARELLARPGELEQLGQMARSAVQKVRGASRRNAELLLDLIAARARQGQPTR